MESTKKIIWTNRDVKIDDLKNFIEVDELEKITEKIYNGTATEKYIKNCTRKLSEISAVYGW